MKNLLLLIALIWACQASSNEYDDARVAVGKAILAYPKVKAAKKKVEKLIEKKVLVTGITKKQVATTFAITKSAIEGKVSTDSVNIRTKMLGGEMRPNLEYNWRDNSTLATVDFRWSW